MTDRLNGFIVVLEQDIREDDAEAILTALMQVRGVLTVTPNVAGPDEAIAEERIRSEMRDKVFQFLKGI